LDLCPAFRYPSAVIRQAKPFREAFSRRGLGMLGAAVLLPVALVLGRSLILGRALSTASRLAADVGLAVHAGLGTGGVVSDPRAPVGLSLLRFWFDEGVVGTNLEANADADANEASVPTGEQPQVPHGRRLGPVPQTVTLSQAQVLSLARGSGTPRGASRSAAGALPAGIEILDGQGLGIGWFPGDRLILVAGVPVADRGSVISRVIELRSSHVPLITATLARRTPDGVRLFEVHIEQPYLEDLGGEVEPAAQ
jgi:hypothetical protein